MPLSLHYDPNSDVLTVDNIRYKGDLFRTLAFASPGTWMRISERYPDGVLTLRTVPTNLELQFDELVELELHP